MDMNEIVKKNFQIYQIEIALTSIGGKQLPQERQKRS